MVAFPIDAIDENIYHFFLGALLNGDRKGCDAVVTDLANSGTDVRVIYVDLLQRAMYAVGELWEANRISVAKEHLATAITEGAMSLLYPRIFSGSRIGRSAVVSCVANEYHQIGGKMVADIFELNGWDGFFLGANTPEAELLAFVQERKPDVLGL